MSKTSKTLSLSQVNCLYCHFLNTPFNGYMICYFVLLKLGSGISLTQNSMYITANRNSHSAPTIWLHALSLYNGCDFNPFSARGPIYRPPLCLRKMREADVSAHFFQALQYPYLTSYVRSIYTAAKSAAYCTLIGSSFVSPM